MASDPSTNTAEFCAYLTWFGLNTKAPNHYELLGLKPLESNVDAIESCAEQRMTFLQTASAGEHGREATRLLNEVSAARICLLNDESKAAYDRGIRTDRLRKRVFALSFALALLTCATMIGAWSNAPKEQLVENRREKAPTASRSVDAENPPSADKVSEIRVRARIDGTDELRIWNKSLTWAHHDWAWPPEVYINGKRWDVRANQTFLLQDSDCFDFNPDFGRTQLLINAPFRGLLQLSTVKNHARIWMNDGAVGTGFLDVTVRVMPQESVSPKNRSE